MERLRIFYDSRSASHETVSFSLNFCVSIFFFVHLERAHLSRTINPNLFPWRNQYGSVLPLPDAESRSKIFALELVYCGSRSKKKTSPLFVNRSKCVAFIYRGILSRIAVTNFIDLQGGLGSASRTNHNPPSFCGGEKSAQSIILIM